MFELLIAFAVASMVAHVVFSIMVMAALDRRGIKTSILLSRLYIIKYVSQYRAVTIEETGRAGLLFYLWIISINFAALMALIAFIIR
jgi:hypothetical protein